MCAAGLACALQLATPARAASWDPILPAERESKRCPFDSTAGAELLFWRVWVEDQSQAGTVETVREHYVRAKIYSDAAAQDWTKHTITLASSDARVSGIAARTIQADGTIADLDPHSVAKEVVARVRGEKVKTVTFAIPAVRAGSIVEYRLTETQDDALTEYEEFPLQMEWPARSIQYFLRPLAVEGWHQRQMVFHAQLLPEKKQATNYSLLEVANVPAFKREPNMPPENQVRAWMLVYYSDEQLSTPKTFWVEKGKDAAEWFDGYVRADDSMRKTAKGIVEGAKTPDEQLQRLVEWCRREIHVPSDDEPRAPHAHKLEANKDARSVLRQRAGSGKELDLTFGALARAAGFDVRYLRVPSRKKIYFDQEMMDLRFVPSYDIAVRVGSHWRCFDPQMVSLPWDMLPWDEESQMALICDHDSTMFLETTVSDPERSVRTRSGELTLDEEGTLEGDVSVELTGHWNAVLRTSLSDAADSLKEVRSQLDWDGDWLELSALHIEPTATPSDPLRFTVHAKLPAHAVPSGRRILLEPTAWWAHREPDFGESRRRWPVEFPFSWTDRDSLRIRLPAGWKCETVAAPKPAVAPGVAELHTRLRELESGAVLEVRRDFQLGFDGQILFPASSYPDLRRLFALFTDADRFTTPLVQSGDKP
jgi:hypothetical protein